MTVALALEDAARPLHTFVVHYITQSEHIHPEARWPRLHSQQNETATLAPPGHLPEGWVLPYPLRVLSVLSNGVLELSSADIAAVSF
jgi:hypothetical protein